MQDTPKTFNLRELKMAETRGDDVVLVNILAAIHPDTLLLANIEFGDATAYLSQLCVKMMMEI